MKKFIICAAVLAAGLMTSCNKDTNYCWEITTTVTAFGITTSTTTYHWATENELDAIVAELKSSAVGENVTVEHKRTRKAQSECHKDAE